MVKEGYKKTEFGEIPVEWKVKRIEEISNVNPENLPNNTNGDLLINYVDIESVSTGKISNIKRILFEDSPSRARRKIKSNDVIISTVRPYLKAFTIIKEELDNLVCSTGFTVIRAKKNMIPQYIYEYTLSENFIKQLNTAMVGSNYPAVNSTDIKKALIMIPPLPEQQKIASILSTVDQHIEETEALIQKTKELKKGLMQKLLTKGIGHTEFKKTEVGEIPVEWEVKKLGDVIKVSSGSGLSQKNMIKGKYPVYGGNGIAGYHNEFNFIDKKIIIGRVGAKCGCVYITQAKSWITDNALYVSNQIEEFNLKFMFYLLNYINLNKFANKNAQPVISGNKIYKILIQFTSYKEQVKIATILINVDKKIAEYEHKKEKLQSLKKGLMQQLLTGRKRVI